MRYKHKKSNIIKLKKYLKYVDTNQYRERSYKLQNKINK
jgi:hypothetical protein